MPKADLMIIAGGAPEEGAPAPEADFSEEVAAAEDADAKMYENVSPKGRFSSKALNALVKATNQLLPAFDQAPEYPKFDPGTYETFPEDFTRILSMFSSAARDAAVEDTIGEDLVFDFTSATDDNDLQMIAGKINALSKAKAFKKWLGEQAKEEEAVEAPAEDPAAEAPKGEAMSDDEVDDLFASRI